MEEKSTSKVEEVREVWTVTEVSLSLYPLSLPTFKDPKREELSDEGVKLTELFLPA